MQNIIPIDRKAAFSGKVEITARIKLDEEDLVEIRNISKMHNLHINEAEIMCDFDVDSIYSFSDSLPKGKSSIWGISIETKKTKSGKFKTYTRPKTKTEPDLWLDIVNNIESRLPRIVYFPTFLVDMPPRIYLTEHDNETPVNSYYRTLIQDILTSIDSEFSIERHVINRISTYKKGASTPTWLASFFAAPTKSHIDSVFQRIASAVTREVIGSWEKVFRRPSGAKNVLVDWNIDTQLNDIPYVSFWLSDGDSRYAVSERSLGFRWFFSLLLFTAFKSSSKNPTIFLFDEPAANLHARAQAELLTNFDRICSGKNKIIYSTHSHHMIEPRWLSSAYIVENEAIDYDGSDSFELSTKPTNIKATPYRQFVSQYPSRVSYFQPVIEKLDYISPNIIGSGPYIILEGITDYYAFRLVTILYPDAAPGVSIMPGTGAGASGALISYLMGRGERFCVVLDADAAGKKAALRYRDGWYLDEKFIVTLNDLDDQLDGKMLEDLLSGDTENKIQEYLGVSVRPNKRDINAYLAEGCGAPHARQWLSADAEGVILSILRATSRRFL
ncbi:hypothetical protein J2X65_003818 [Ancylobacter sp. 3268]|uniref:AAA family ATPase n=1 Tax=Ancylobacter sp. 3268 TaxID=2817752 RepID=UPI002856DD6B|nr:AAA family ATPase [Ancylobacter sp. 3268]MDR6954448.1 hypothetical protein [Ancylobacter sp. 3268]